ncbi:MAG: NAD(P)-binding protein [Myxococcales bacterium]
MTSSHTTTDLVAHQTTPVRHRVVIVGCGFGGLFATRALRRADVDVTIIDRNNSPFSATAVPASNGNSLRG